MKTLFTCIFVGYSFMLMGQKLPEVGMNVRINDLDRTTVAEIRPTSANVKALSDAFYYWYGAGVIHTTQGGFSGKLLNGKYAEYFLNKNLKEQGVFNNGLKNGAWKSWNNDGTLIQLITYYKGHKSGEFSLYDDKGHIMRSGTYNNDELDGTIEDHFKDSLVVHVYKKGKLQPNKEATTFWRKLNVFKHKPHKTSAPLTKVKS